MTMCMYNCNAQNKYKNNYAVIFLNVLGRRSFSSSSEERESVFLFQRISVTAQRFNAILLHNCFVRDDPDL